MAGHHPSDVVAVFAGDLTEISYMEGWPALLVLIVVLVIVGARNPYRRILRERAAADRARAQASSPDDHPEEDR